MRPRASGSQYGEPRPVSAGTKTTPSVESTEAASASVSPASVDEPEPVSQPLHRRAGDEHRPFEGELALRSRRNGGRRPEETLGRRVAGAADVDENEAARAVRGLGLTGGEAAAGRRGPPAGLRRSRRSARPRRGDEAFADDAARRRRRAARARARLRRARAARHPSRARRDREACVREAFVTSTTCVRTAVSFQTSQESTVPKARSRCGRSERFRIHSSFVAEKYGSGQEAGPLADQVARQLAAALGRTPVLPDDRALHRVAGAAIPDDRRLALVRDPDGRELGRRDAGTRRVRPRLLRARSARSPRDRARPSRAAESTAGSRGSRDRRSGARRRRRGTSSPSFPGRSRAARAEHDGRWIRGRLPSAMGVVRAVAFDFNGTLSARRADPLRRLPRHVR